MDASQIIDAISKVGFPIVIALVLLWKDYKFTARIIEMEALENQVILEIKNLLSDLHFKQ